MSFDEETPISVDGEILRTTELSLSLQTSALRFWIPDGVTPRKKKDVLVAEEELVLRCN